MADRLRCFHGLSVSASPASGGGRIPLHVVPDTKGTGSVAMTRIPDPERTGSRIRDGIRHLRCVFLVLLALPALQASPLRAGTTMLYTDVVCGSGLTLQRASETASGAKSYGFGGVCSLRGAVSGDTGTWASVAGRPPVSAFAHWDKGSHTYAETLHLLAAQTIGKLHVGTAPEQATFTCDVDPIVNRRAHCTLVKQDNATGWGGQGDGFAWGPVHNKPLLAGTATAAQVAAVSKHSTPIRCRDLHLQKGSGGVDPRYQFNGTCKLYHTQDGSKGLQVTHVLVNGRWDAAGRQAKQGVTVLSAPSEGGGGWTTTYTCNDDPWRNAHAQCSVTAQLGHPPPVYDPITDLLDRHPLAMGMGRQKTPMHFADAPHPSAHKSSTHLQVATKAQPTAKPAMHTLSGPAPAGAVPMRTTGGALHRAAPHVPPHLRVIREDQRTDSRCTNLGRLLVLRETVYNDGGPLAAGHATVQVRETRSDGAHLGSRAIPIPTMAHAGRAQLTVPVGTTETYRGRLPGRHQLEVDLVTDAKTVSSGLLVSFPAHYCQLKLRAPNASQLRPASPSPKLNPQPEPPSKRTH